MISGSLVLAVSLGYLALLFAVAALADRRAAGGRAGRGAFGDPHYTATKRKVNLKLTAPLPLGSPGKA